MGVADAFSWSSTLGVSVVLFLVYGGFQVFIGALTPFLYASDAARRAPIGNERTDTAVFGAAPERLWDSDPAYRNLWRITVHVIAGLLVAAGLLAMTVAWFGLRAGQHWALGVLGGTGAMLLVFWWLAYAPYREVGASVGLGSIPPFMLVPGVLLVPASVLGWIGLR